MTFVDDNIAARERVLAVVTPLTDEVMAVALDGGWTIAAELAHLAFWDRVHVGRLRASIEAQGDLPARLGSEATDAINDSGLHAWRLIEGRAAIGLFAEASTEVDAYLATVDPAIVERVRTAGLNNLVERHHHRILHGDAIEKMLRDRSDQP